jgi:hypothetical protein
MQKWDKVFSWSRKQDNGPYPWWRGRRNDVIVSVSKWMNGPVSVFLNLCVGVILCLPLPSKSRFWYYCKAKHVKVSDSSSLLMGTLKCNNQSNQHTSHFSSISTETRLWAEHPENKEFILDKDKICLFFTIQTSSEAH